MSISNTISNTDWATNAIWPTFQSPNHLEVYDIRSASQDVQLAMTTMTGNINRQQPQVYLLNSNDAAYWLQEVFAHIPQDVSPATGNAALDAMLNSFASSIQGMIIYDPNCSDSINIATMLAGQRDGIVVSPPQATALQGPPHRLPVIADLRIYQWKNRIQAYTWAKRNLLKNAAPNLIAGLDPKISGTLRSFLVATRTFIYWLDASSWFPDIFNGWVSERGLMQSILSAFPAGTIYLGWFIDEPHGVKYTSQAAMPVLASDFFENLEVWTSVQNMLTMQLSQVEIETDKEVMVVTEIEIEEDQANDDVGTGQAPSSALNLAPSSATEIEIEEDRSVTEIEIVEYQDEEEAPDLARNVGVGLAPTLQQARDVGTGQAPSSASNLDLSPASHAGSGPAATPKAYVSFTISDGDNLQYDQHRMAGLWKDPVRGSFPIGWTISPSLVQTAPSLAAYYMNTSSPNDELIAGPSGAGYIFPSDWPQAQLPAFLKLTGELMQAMKLDLIQVLDDGSSQAFVNPGLQTAYVNALTPFGLKGILSGSGQTQSSWTKISGVPVLQNLGLANSVSKAVSLVKNASAKYLNVYVMAWTMTPSDLHQVVQQLGNAYTVVTPGRLLGMIS